MELDKGWDTSYDDEEISISELLGKTLVSIERVNEFGEKLRFLTDTGEKYLMYHDQNCCESVSIDDIVGELDDLIGSPITFAEESTNRNDPKVEDDWTDDSHTWTFYKFATIKGFVDIKWYGSSNGYYSESVQFVKIKE